MIRALLKLVAFLKRDFQSDASYRFAFLFQIAGIFVSLCAFWFMTGMIDPQTEGLDGIQPFAWMLVGLAFQYYFSTALWSFSQRIRNDQVLGTLEAMLVTPTPTPVVIFSSSAWDFTYGALRVIVYLLFAGLVFGVPLYFNSVDVLLAGIILTLLSSAGIGILSASMILYFKRGDPINLFLSALTTFFGTVFFPKEQLPGFLQAIPDFLPITWSLKIVRGALLKGVPSAELWPYVGRLAILTVILLPAGVFLSRIAIRKAKREGSLVQY